MSFFIFSACQNIKWERGCRVQVCPWSSLNLHHMSTADSLWRTVSTYNGPALHSRWGLCLSVAPESITFSPVFAAFRCSPASFIVASCCLNEVENRQIGDRSTRVVILVENLVRRYLRQIRFLSCVVGCMFVCCQDWLLCFFSLITLISSFVWA